MKQITVRVSVVRFRVPRTDIASAMIRAIYTVEGARNANEWAFTGGKAINTFDW